MELILIVIIFFVVKTIKQASEEQAKGASKRSTTYQNSQQTNQYKQAVRENLEKARQLAQASPREIYEQLNMSGSLTKQSQPLKEKNEHFQQADMHRQQENRAAMRQVHASRMEARNTTILQRAQTNTEEDKIDVTLQTMEAEHNHSERVSAAVHHHSEDVMPENMLGNIEDLMVKGYDGNLCFERDFLGEAMDMISRFTVPSDVPDFSKNDVA